MIDDDEYDAPDAKARLVWYSNGFGRSRDGSSTTLDLAAKDEEDIKFINVRCAEVWSVVEAASFMCRSARSSRSLRILGLAGSPARQIVLA
jgi:hypothetical protein